MSFDDFSEPHFRSPDDSLAGHAPGRPGARPRLRPPVGIPEAIPEGPRWRGTVLSILLHALVIAMLIVPLAAPALVPEILNQGAGGPGPAGGGGGGTGGTGGERVDERVQYIDVAPPSAPPDPTRLQPPVEQKPEEKKPEEKKPAAPLVDINVDAKVPDVTSVSVARGTGGGTGNDGTAGSGPGSGGGVGSGVGTGRGSGVGPGTGGGPGTVYPPTPVNLVIPPIGLGQKYCPYAPTAFFDVDERGNATLILVNPPARDGGYQRKLVAALRDYRFRPATKWDGTPVRDTIPIGLTVC